MLQSTIDEYLGQNESSVFLADHLGNSKQLIKHCWDLDMIRLLYDQFIAQWQPVQDQVQNWSDAKHLFIAFS